MTTTDNKTDTADKEQLKLAAKAAGIGPLDFDYPEREGHGMYFGPRLPMPQGVIMAANHAYWSPRTDDGDAFRLQAKLRFTVKIADHECEVFDEVAGCLASIPMLNPSEDEVREATRHAITCAAAEIGKAMP